MRVMKILTICAVLLAVFSTQQASATLLLPDSSYADGDWQGTVYHETDNLLLRIDFAVYDTQGGNEFQWDAQVEKPAEDRFIYAYQIFNHSSSQISMTAFELLGVEQAPINATSWQADGHEGIAPAESFAQASWEFFGEDGPVIAGGQSAFLVFSSSNEPIAGDFEVSTTENSDEVPGPHAPEPASLLILGIGAVIIRTRSAKRNNG